MSFRDRDVRKDAMNAPDGIVGIVGGAGSVRRSGRSVGIDVCAEVRGGDDMSDTVADAMVADAMVANGSGGDGVFEVEESPYLSVREVRPRRCGLGFALAMRARVRLAMAGGARRGRMARVGVLDGRGADTASCLGIVFGPEVHGEDDVCRWVTWRCCAANEERNPDPRSLGTVGRGSGVAAEQFVRSGGERRGREGADDEGR